MLPGPESRWFSGLFFFLRHHGDHDNHGVMRRHRTFRPVARRVAGAPDLRLLDGVVSPKILRAMRAASKQLYDAGVRHALIGGLSVGAYGYARSTGDVDFLVGDEAFETRGGGLVTIVQGIPIAVGDVGVDPVSIAPGEEHLDAAVESPAMSGTVPVVPIEALVYLKLKSRRKRDLADIVELIKRGIDVKRVIGYLQYNAPHLEDAFLELYNAAQSEDM